MCLLSMGTPSKDSTSILSEAGTSALTNSPTKKHILWKIQIEFRQQQLQEEQLSLEQQLLKLTTYKLKPLAEKQCTSRVLLLLKQGLICLHLHLGNHFLGTVSLALEWLMNMLLMTQVLRPKTSLRMPTVL